MSSARSSGCAYRASIFHWYNTLYRGGYVGSGKIINNIKYYCPLLFVEYIQTTINKPIEHRNGNCMQIVVQVDKKQIFYESLTTKQYVVAAMH